MHVELEQLHVCHAYIKQAQIEEFSSGGVQPSKKILQAKKKKTPRKWEMVGASVFVLH